MSFYSNLQPDLAQSEEKDIGDDISKLEERLHEQVFHVLALALVHAFMLTSMVFSRFLDFIFHGKLCENT